MAMKIDTMVIRAAAEAVSKKNDELLATLRQTETTVRDLGSSWSGAAAEAAIGAYSAFAGTHFQSYHDMLNMYVKFLNGVAGEGYEAAEKAITGKADEI